MSLPWIRFQTSFPSSPEIVGLIDRKRHSAVVAFVCGLAYCGQHDATGGFIPKGALPFVHASKRDAADLVDCGLWQRGPTGYIVTGWDKYQQSNITQADRANSGRHAACVRWHTQPCSKCSPVDEEVS